MMTGIGWLIFGIFGVFCLAVGVGLFICSDTHIGKIIVSVVTLAILAGLFMGIRWYFTDTEAGKRESVSFSSNVAGGLERDVVVYTANGDIIAEYHGKIDLQENKGGYVMFDFEGKRYVYYNCFVESIAEIGK